MKRLFLISLIAMISIAAKAQEPQTLVIDPSLLDSFMVGSQKYFKLKIPAPLPAPTQGKNIFYSGTNYTLNDSAYGRVIVCSSDNPITFNVPPGLKTPFNCRITPAGNGIITFKPGIGVSLLNRSKLFKSSGANADIEIYNTSLNTYNLCGNLKQ